MGIGSVVRKNYPYILIVIFLSLDLSKGSKSPKFTPDPSSSDDIYEIEAGLGRNGGSHNPKVKCNGHEIKCKDGRTCIPMSNFQDGIKDCPDGSDEVCYDWQFDCGWGSPKCIMTDQIKDGRIDCQNGIDENCGLSDFMCHDKKNCVPIRKYQDGKKDCSDGSDEVCRFNQFECKLNKTCISMAQFQNGFADCNDGSDEECFDNEFKCQKGGLPVCIDRNFIQDGKNDCESGEDEELEHKPTSTPPNNIRSEKLPDLRSFDSYRNTKVFSDSKYAPPSTYKKEEISSESHDDLGNSVISPRSSSLLGPTLMSTDTDLPICNLNNQGFECAHNAICRIGDQGIPECSCQPNYAYDGAFRRCIGITEYPMTLSISKRNDKLIRFIDSYVDHSSNEYVEMRRLVIEGLKQVLSKSPLHKAIQQIKFNYIVDRLYDNEEDSKPGITINSSIFIKKNFDGDRFNVHNELFRALAKSNFVLGNTNLSVEPLPVIKERASIHELLPNPKPPTMAEVNDSSCLVKDPGNKNDGITKYKRCGPHSVCQVANEIPVCVCQSGYYTSQQTRNTTDPECVESIAIPISLRFLRNGYLSLDYEKLIALDNNENIISLKEQAIRAMDELFTKSDVVHLYLGSEIVGVKKASLYNDDWQSTIILQFYLHFRKTITDVKQSQIYRIIYNHFVVTKSRLGHTSHLYFDISSIPGISIKSAIYGLTFNRNNRNGNILGKGECHLDTNQGCGKNADCRVLKGIVKCLCRIGYHSIQQTRDCIEFEVQNVILLIKKNEKYTKQAAFKDMEENVDGEIGNTIFNDDDFMSVITPKMRSILGDPRYKDVFIDMNVKSMGPPVMRNAAFNVTLFLKSGEKSTKKRDLDSMIIDMLNEGVTKMDTYVETDKPDIFLNDTQYKYSERVQYQTVRNNIINFGLDAAQLDNDGRRHFWKNDGEKVKEIGYSGDISYEIVCDLRDNSGCQPNAICKYVRGELGCFCSRGYYLWKRFGKCIAYRTFNLMLWIIRKDGQPVDYEDYLRNIFSPKYTDLSNLAKAGVDYTFQFSNFRPFYLDSIVQGFVYPKEINDQWDRGIILNVTILAVNSYPGNIDDVYDELRQALVTSNGELGSTRLIVHTNSLFPIDPQGSAFHNSNQGVASYDLCKPQNNLGCGENSLCTKVSGFASCVCFPGYYLKPGTDRCVAPDSYVVYVRGINQWVRPFILKMDIEDKTSKDYQELARNVQSHVSELLKSGPIKNYYLNSEVNSIIDYPATKQSVSSAIFNFTIYVTKDYLGNARDIHLELIRSVDSVSPKIINGTNMAIDTNFEGLKPGKDININIQWDFREKRKKIVNSIRVISSHQNQIPLSYSKLIKDAPLRNQKWEEGFYQSFINGIILLLKDSKLPLRKHFIQIENVTDPQIYQKKWKDGIIIIFSISVPEKYNVTHFHAWDQILSQLYKTDGKIPNSDIRLDLTSFQCCHDYEDVEHRLSRAVSKVSDKINTKSVTVFAEADVTLIQLNPEIYHVKYNFITEKIKKRERNIYSKAHINQIHEKIYSVFHNVLTNKDIKTAGLGAMKFNFTIDFKLNLNFGPEYYIYNGNNISETLITVIKNAKSGTFLIMSPDAISFGGDKEVGSRYGGKRLNVIIKFSPLPNAKDEKQLSEVDLQGIKERFLDRIDRVSSEAGLAKYLRAKNLVAIYNEYQEDSDGKHIGADPESFLDKEFRGYGLIGVLVIVVSEDYPFSGHKLLLSLNEHLKLDSRLSSNGDRDSKAVTKTGHTKNVPYDFELILPHWYGSFIYTSDGSVNVRTTFLPVLARIQSQSISTSTTPPTKESEVVVTSALLNSGKDVDDEVKKYFILLRIARYKSMPLVYKVAYKDQSSNDYLNLKRIAEMALNEAYRYSNLNKVFVKSEIQNIQDAFEINSEWKNSILLNFTAGFKKEYKGAQEEVFKSLINSIIQTGFRVGDSDLYVISEGEGRPSDNNNNGIDSSSSSSSPNRGHLPSVSQRVVAKVEFQSLSGSSKTEFMVQKVENSKVYVNDQVYVECDAGRGSEIVCDDPLTRCLRKVGLFKNGDPECICSHGFTRRVWTKPSSIDHPKDKGSCHKYRAVDLMLKVIGIEFRNIHVGKIHLIPNTPEYDRLIKLISRELTTIMVKSSFQKHFLRMDVKNVTNEIGGTDFNVGPYLLVHLTVYFQYTFNQNENAIRRRLNQEIELFKRNLDKIGLAIEVIEPDLLAQRPKFKRIQSLVTSPTTTRTTTHVSRPILGSPATLRPYEPFITTPENVENSVKFLEDSEEILFRNNIRSFKDLSDNAINDRTEARAFSPTTPLPPKSPVDFLKVSDNKLVEVNCQLGTSIGCGVDEECILNNGRSICRCIFGFAKETNTTMCIAHKTVDVQLRIDTIKNISMLELYKGGLVDRKNSNFVHFIMDELDHFVAESEYARYIIETRFNNLAKIHYEKDPLTEHILLNFTIMIKKTFQGNLQGIVSSLIARIRTLRFRLESKAASSASAFKDLTSVIQTEDFNFIMGETFESLDLQGVACSYEETLVCAQNKELCKVIKGRPICLCRYGFARPSNITNHAGTCTPSFYYFIVIRIIRDKERILDIESIDHSPEKETIIANFEKLGKQALDYTVLSSDLKEFFLNSKFNSIINPKNIDERWKDLGIGLNFTLVLSQNYRGTTRNIAKSLSALIIRNDYKLPGTDYYVIPLLSSVKDLEGEVDEEEEDIENYLVRNDIKYSTYEINLQPRSPQEGENGLGELVIEDSIKQISKDLRSSELKGSFLGIKLKDDNLDLDDIGQAHLKRINVILYFRQGSPPTLTSIKDVVKISIGHKFTVFLKNVPNQSFKGSHALADRKSDSGYLYALEIDIDGGGNYDDGNFGSESPLYKEIASNFSTAVNKIFSKSPLKGGYYKGVEINGISFSREISSIHRSAIVNFTIYVSTSNDQSFEEISTNILREIVDSNYQLDAGTGKIAIRPESLTTYNIGAVSFVVLLSVLRQGSTPLVYSDGLYDKKSAEYKNFARIFINGVRESLKGSDMEKYLVGADINSISPTPAPSDAEAIVNLGVVVNFTLHFTPIFKVSDDQAKILLTKLISQRNYQLGQTELFVSPIPLPPLAQSICLTEQSRGSCTGNFTRWYFDSATKMCRDFPYSGCQGNGNNFLSLSQCLSACMFYIPRCHLPLDAGVCSQKIVRFYYDDSISECRNFIYTGCGGNYNNFKFWKSCNNECNPSKNAESLFLTSPKPKSRPDLQPTPTTTEPSIYIIHNRPENGITTTPESRKFIFEQSTTARKSLVQVGTNAKGYVFPIAQRYDKEKPKVRSAVMLTTTAATTTVKLSSPYVNPSFNDEDPLNLTSWLGINPRFLDNQDFNPYIDPFNLDYTGPGAIPEPAPESVVQDPERVVDKIYGYQRNRQFQQDFKAETVPILSVSPKDEIISIASSSSWSSSAAGAKEVKVGAKDSGTVDIDVFEDNDDYLYNANRGKNLQNGGSQVPKHYDNEWVKEDLSLISGPSPQSNVLIHKTFRMGELERDGRNRILKDSACESIDSSNATCDQLSLCYSNEVFKELCGCVNGGEKRKFSETECVATSQYILYQPVANLTLDDGTRVLNRNEQTSNYNKEVSSIFKKGVRETIKNTTLDNYFIGTRINNLINVTNSKVNGIVVNYTVFMSKNYPGNEKDLKEKLKNPLKEKLSHASLEIKDSNHPKKDPITWKQVNKEFRNLAYHPHIPSMNSKSLSFLIDEKLSNKQFLSHSNVINFESRKVGKQLLKSESSPPTKDNKFFLKTCPNHFIIYQVVRRNYSIPLIYTDHLDDKSSTEYKKLVEAAEDGLDRAFQQSRLRGNFLNTMVGRFIRGEGLSIVIKVLVCVREGYQGTTADVTLALNQSIRSTDNSLGGTPLYVDEIKALARTRVVGGVDEITEEPVVTTNSYTTPLSVPSPSPSFIRLTLSPFSHIDYRLSLGDDALGKTPLYQTLLFEVDLSQSKLSDTSDTNLITTTFTRGLEKVVDKLGLSDYFIKCTVNAILSPQHLSTIGFNNNHDHVIVNVTIYWDVQVSKHNVGYHRMIDNVLCHIRNQMNHVLESNAFTLGDTDIKVARIPIGSMPFIMYLAVPFNASSFPLLSSTQTVPTQTVEYERFRKTLDIGLYQLYFPLKIFAPPNSGGIPFRGTELSYCPEPYEGGDDEGTDNNYYGTASYYLGNKLNGITIRRSGPHGIAFFILNFTLYIDLNSGALDMNGVRMDLIRRINTYGGHLGKTGLKIFLATEKTRHASRETQSTENAEEIRRAGPTLKGIEEESLTLPLVSISGRPIEYSISYANPDSEEYKKLDKDFKHYLDEIFLSSPLRGVYQGIRINGIKPLTAAYNGIGGQEKGILINYTVVVYSNYNDDNLPIAPNVPLRIRLDQIVDRNFDSSATITNFKSTGSTLPHTKCLPSQKLCRFELVDGDVLIATPEPIIPTFDRQDLPVPRSAGHGDIGQNGYQSLEERAFAYPLQLTLYKSDVSEAPLYWDKEYENTESTSYVTLIEGAKKMLDNVFAKAPQLTGRYAGVRIDRVSPYLDELSAKAYITFDLTVYLAHNGPSLGPEDDLSQRPNHLDKDGGRASNTHIHSNYNGEEDAGGGIRSGIGGVDRNGQLLKLLYGVVYDNFVRDTSPLPGIAVNSAAQTQYTPSTYYEGRPFGPEARAPTTGSYNIHEYGQSLSIDRRERENGMGTVSRSSLVEDRLEVQNDPAPRNLQFKELASESPSTIRDSDVKAYDNKEVDIALTGDDEGGVIIDSAAIRQQISINTGDGVRHSAKGFREYLVLLNVLRRNQDALIFHPEFSNGNDRSETYSYVVTNSRIGLDNIIRGSELTAYYISCKVNGILDPEVVNLPSPANGIIVNFTVTFTEYYLGTQENIFNVVSQKLIDSGYNLPGTDLFVDPAPNKVEYELEFNFEETGIQNFSQLFLYDDINQQRNPNQNLDDYHSSNIISNQFKSGVKNVLLQTPLAGYILDGKIKNIKYGKSGNLTFVLDVLLKPDYPGSKKDLYKAIYDGFERNAIPLTQNSTIKLLRYKNPVSLSVGLMRLNDTKLTFMPEYRDINSNQYKTLQKLFVRGMEGLVSHTAMASKLRAIKMVDIEPENPKPDHFEDLDAINATYYNNNGEEIDRFHYSQNRGEDDEGLRINYEADLGRDCDAECEEKFKVELREAITRNYNQIGDSGLFTEPLISKHLVGNEEFINRLVTANQQTLKPYQITNEVFSNSPTASLSSPSIPTTSYNVYRERYSGLSCNDANTLTGCGLNQFCEISTEGLRAVCQCFPGYLKSHTDGNCIDSRHINSEEYYQTYPNLHSQLNIITGAPNPTSEWAKPPILIAQNSCTDKNSPNGCGLNARCVYHRASNIYECQCVIGHKNQNQDCISLEAYITSPSVFISPKASSPTPGPFDYEPGQNNFPASLGEANTIAPYPRTFARYNSFDGTRYKTTPSAYVLPVANPSIANGYGNAVGTKTDGNSLPPVDLVSNDRSMPSNFVSTPTFTYSPPLLYNARDYESESSSFTSSPVSGVDSDRNSGSKDLLDDTYHDVRVYGDTQGFNDTASGTGGSIVRVDHTVPGLSRPVATHSSGLVGTNVGSVHDTGPDSLVKDGSFRNVSRRLFKDLIFGRDGDKDNLTKRVIHNTPNVKIYDNVVKSITYRLTHVANVTGKNGFKNDRATPHHKQHDGYNNNNNNNNHNNDDEDVGRGDGNVQKQIVRNLNSESGYVTCREDSNMASGCPLGKRCVVLQKNDHGGNRRDAKYAICVCEDNYVTDPQNSDRCIALSSVSTSEAAIVSTFTSQISTMEQGCDPDLNRGCGPNEYCSIINGHSLCQCSHGFVRIYPSSVCLEVAEVPLYIEVMRQGKDPFYYKTPLIDPTSSRSKELFKGAQLGLNDMIERTKISPFFLGTKLNNIYQIYQEKKDNETLLPGPRIRTIFNYTVLFNDQKSSSLPLPTTDQLKTALTASLLANRGYLGNTDLYINPATLNGTGIKLYEIYIHILSKHDQPLQYISTYGDPDSWQYKYLANTSENGLRKTLAKSPMNDFLSVVKLMKIYDGQNFENDWNGTSVFKFVIGLQDIYPGNSRNISSSLASSIIRSNYTLGTDLKVNPVSVDFPRLSVYDFTLNVNKSVLSDLNQEALKLFAEKGVSKLLAATTLGSRYFGSEFNDVKFYNDTKTLVGSALLNVSIFIPAKYGLTYQNVKRIFKGAIKRENYKLGNTGLNINKISPFSLVKRRPNKSLPKLYTTKSTSPVYSTQPSRGKLDSHDLNHENFVTKPVLTNGPSTFSHNNKPLMSDMGKEMKTHGTIVIAPEIEDKEAYKLKGAIKDDNNRVATRTNSYRTIPVDQLSTPANGIRLYSKFLKDPQQNTNKGKNKPQTDVTDDGGVIKGFNFNQNNLEISEALLSDLCGIMSCSNGKVCRILDGQPTCVCKPGYSRKDKGPCFVAKKYSIIIRVLRDNDTYLTYNSRFQNQSSQEYRKLWDKAEHALEQQVQNTKLYPWLIKAPLVKIDDSKNYPDNFKDTSGYKVPILVYNFDVDATYNGGQNIIRQEVMRSIALNNNSLGNSGLYVDPLPLVRDIDECSMSMLNDCHQLATCINTIGSFTCKCLDGYIDNSIDDFVTSGRLCNAPVSDCSDEHCSYRGSCRVDAEKNKRVCDCDKWWVGRQCQHSGKLIAIISGFILCLALLLCCFLPVWLCFRRKRTRRQAENMRWAYDTMSKDTFGISSTSDKDTTDSNRIIPSMVIPRARLSEAARSQISSKLKEDTFDDILPSSWDDSFMHIPRPVLGEMKNYNPQALALVHESDSRSDRSDTQLINEGSLKGFPKSPPTIESSMEAQVKRAREKIATASEFYRQRYADELGDSNITTNSHPHFDRNDRAHRSEISSASYGKLNRNNNNNNNINTASNDSYGADLKYGKSGGVRKGRGMGKEEPNTTEITEETTTTVEEWTKRYRRSTAAGLGKKMATSTQTEGSSHGDKNGMGGGKTRTKSNNVPQGNGGPLSSSSTTSSDYSYYEYKGDSVTNDPCDSDDNGNGCSVEASNNGKGRAPTKPSFLATSNNKKGEEGSRKNRDVTIDYYQEGDDNGVVNSTIDTSQRRNVVVEAGKPIPRFKRNNSAIGNIGGPLGPNATGPVSKYYRNHKANAVNTSVTSNKFTTSTTNNVKNGDGSKQQETGRGGQHIRAFPKRLSSSASDISTNSSINITVRSKMKSDKKTQSDDQLLINIEDSKVNSNEQSSSYKTLPTAYEDSSGKPHLSNNASDAPQNRYYFSRKISDYDREEVASMSEAAESRQATYRGLDNLIHTHDQMDNLESIENDIFFKNIPMTSSTQDNVAEQEGGNKKSKKKMNQMSKIAAEASHVCKAWQRSGRLTQIVSNSGEGTWSSKGNYPEEVASYSEAEGTVRDRKYVRQNSSAASNNAKKNSNVDPRSLYNLNPKQHFNIGYESDENFKI